jgi:GntR family transcriptional regulator, arabinose operon transcriptional repressor
LLKSPKKVLKCVAWHDGIITITVQCEIQVVTHVEHVDRDYLFVSKRESLPTAKPESRSHRSRLKHRQLRSELLGQIATGQFRPGDALPSEHQLAELMSVSRTTVRQTLGDLEREGLVHRVQGKGTFVAERPNDQPVPRTASLALIVPDVATGYFPTLVAGFDQAANEVGRPIVVCNTHNEVDKQANYLMRLIDQRVAGALLCPSTRDVTPAYQVRLVQEAGIPVVLLHRGVPDTQAPVLELPTVEIGRRAGRLVAEAGHRHVAYLASHRYTASESYERGFREAIVAAGGELPEHMIDYGNLTRFDAEDWQSFEQYLEGVLARMLSGSRRPTALFASFDPVAEMVYLIVGRMGLKVPEDLSIVCFGGDRREGAIARRLTAITVDEADTARQAVELLVEMQSGRRSLNDQDIRPMPLGLSTGQTLLRLA